MRTQLAPLMRMRVWILAVFAAACASSAPVYQPEGLGTQPETPVAVRLPLPGGDLQVPTTRMRNGALEVHMTVANRTRDETWTVDERQQMLLLSDGERLAPEVEGSGLYPLAPGQRHTFTLRYPIPAVDRFALSWQVWTGHGPISHEIRFARANLQKLPPDRPAAVPAAPNTVVTPAIPGTTPSPVPPGPPPPVTPTEP